MTARVKALLFDLDGTLRIPTPDPTGAFIDYARSLDVEIGPTAVRRVKVWAHEYWGQAARVKEDMNRFSGSEFWVNYSRLLLETVDATHDLPKRSQLISEWFGSKYKPHVQLSPGSVEVLSTYKQAGYHLGLVSNRQHPLHDDVQALGLGGLFDLVLAAGEIGYWKPEPSIFKHAVSHFPGLSAEECLYVGDNYFADAQGAETAGMTPVLYDPEGLYEDAPYMRIQHMKQLWTIVPVADALV